jgi:ribosomal protein S12 methylthiotransferase
MAEMPEIDAVLGTGEVPQIVQAIGGGVAASGGTSPHAFYRSNEPPAGSHQPPGSGHQPPATRHQPPAYIYDADTPRVFATPRHYAYVKVAEGCDYACAFCIIPTLRGNYRSRPEESIVREARRLAANGVKELLLISQDTTFYGVDRRERGALPRLLRQLNEVDCSTCTPRRLTMRRSRRWRSARRSASTSTCRCSTRPTRC